MDAKKAVLALFVYFMYNRNMNETNEKLNNSPDTIIVNRVEYENLLQELKTLKAKIEELEAANKWFAEQAIRAKNKMYGKSSEKATEEVYAQTSLFDEAETTAYLEELEQKTVTIAAHERKVKKSRSFTMDKLPEDIEVEVEEHTLPAEERTCEYCGSEMTPIGKEVVRTLKVVPAKVVVHEDWYYSYACKNCNGEDENTAVEETPHEPSCYPGSFAAPETVAYIMYEKFVMGAPLYRLEQDFDRKGIPLSRQTMSNWILHCSKVWLKPIYEVLHGQLKKHDIIHADETTLQVLHEPGKEPESKSYIWLYRTGSYVQDPIVLYEYQPGRGGGNPVTFLEGFIGYLQTDGYAGYNGLPNVIHVGCLAHLKRKFHEAVLVLPKNSRKGTAVEGEAYCTKLFEIEKSLADLEPDERYRKRLELEKPVLDAFLAWGNTRHAAEKSTLGKALTYLNNQGAKIANYLLDGRLEISNNLAERSIKPFVIDRKNFLFANTPLGAEGSAIMFSMIETAKENGIDPFKYLTYVFKTAPALSKENGNWAETLTPANLKLLLK